MALDEGIYGRHVKSYDTVLYCNRFVSDQYLHLRLLQCDCTFEFSHLKKTILSSSIPTMSKIL